MVIAGLLSPLSPSFAEKPEFSEFSPVLSRYAIDSFIQAAECLAIRASPSEKERFLVAHRLSASRTEEDIFAPSKMDAWIEQSISDSKSILDAINRNCPSARGEISYFLELAHRDVYAIALGTLDAIVISVIAHQTLDTKELEKIYVNNYSAIGTDHSPF